MSFTFLMILQLVLSSIIMTGCWFLFRRTRKAQIVDIGWALSLFGAGLLSMLGDGDAIHRWILFLMIAIWSLRLAFHLLKRFYRDKQEDPRYAEIRKRLGGDENGLKFYLLFLFQGVLVTLLSIPFFLSAVSIRPWSFWETLGILLFGIGLIGESLADQQLKLYKSVNKKPGVCRVGLWNYSRHPNYFFEWVIWVGFFLYSLIVPLGWVGLISPLLILYLLLKVSGIPLLEEISIRKKGQAYIDYQRSVSSFIPWFPK